MMHRERLSAAAPESTTSVRIWSWDSLRAARIGTPVHADGEENLRRIGSVALPYLSPEHGPGRIAPQGPDRREIGVWLFGLLWTHDSYVERYQERAAKVDRVFGAFVEFDASPRAWRSAAQRSGETGRVGHRSAAREARVAAVKRRAAARRRLDAFVRFGLDRLEGQRLHGEERVWIHLAARGFRHPVLRVCEQCALVFAASRAKRCPGCRRSPVRIQLRPVCDGGWHVAYRVGDRWETDEFERTVHYTAVCRDCQTRFETIRPDKRLCRNCGGKSGRVRRHRGSASRTGRQRYRFTGFDANPISSVGFTAPGGEYVLVHAEAGLIETDDAEVAAALTRMSTVRPLEP